MDRRYPTLSATTDPRYRVPIPRRTDPIDRTCPARDTSYEEIIARECPHPKFKIVEFEHRGRGLVATEPIHRGDLIFKERAAMFFTGEEDSDPMLDSTYAMARDVFTGDAFCTYDFASQLAQTPSRNDEFAEHVAYITEHLLSNVETIEEVTEDRVLRIVNGIHTNSFSLDFADGYAVFMVCSLVNHACKENTGWHTVADVMYLTALEEIPAGTELRINYTFPGIAPKRKRYFLDNYGFLCDCSFCSTGEDPWRCFECACGGVISPQHTDFVCHSCRTIATRQEVERFEEEERRLHAMQKTTRYKYLHHPLRRMHPGHIMLFRAVRAFVMKRACPNPIQLFEDILLPTARHHAELTHGRLYASVLEQYGVSCLRYAQTMPDLAEMCRENAAKAFRMAYDYRCTLGMGRSGFAAATYLEHLALFAAGALDSFVDYEEF